MEADEAIPLLHFPGADESSPDRYVPDNVIKKGTKTEPFKRLLHCAAEVGNLELLESLLEERPDDVRAHDQNGHTPLHLAAKGLHYQCCQALLNYTKFKNEVNLIDKRGNTALHLALTRGLRSSEVSQLLISKGAKLRSPNKGKQTSLHLAAENGNDLLVKQIVNICPKLVIGKDSEGKTPIHLAAQRGMQKSCKILLMANEESNLPETKNAHNIVDKNGRIALHWAAKMAYKECCEHLVKGGCNVNCTDKDGNTPLHLACSSRKEIHQIDCVNLLLKNGADIMIRNNNLKTVLHYTIEKGIIKHAKAIIDLLIIHAKGMEVNFVNMRDNKDTLALHYAIKKGYAEICQKLVKLGSDLNLPKGERGTVLHIAAEKGHNEVCEFLINQVIGGELLDKQRMTPLHLAAMYGGHKCCEVLIKKQKKYLVQDEKGNTALHYAANGQHIQCCKVFMKLRPIAVTKPDKDGWTPLHIAIKQHSLECCKELVTDTTDVWLRHGDTPSPVQYAFQEEVCDIFNLLITSKTSSSRKENKDVDFGMLLRSSLDKIEQSPDMHQNIQNIAFSIINSCHWKEALEDCETHTDNGNFKRLVKQVPETAKVVLDKCMASVSSNKRESDQRKQLAREVDGTCKSSKGAKENEQSSNTEKEDDPLYMSYLDPMHLKSDNSKGAKVKQTPSEVEEQRTKVVLNQAWRTNHALSYMIDGRCHELLDHPLVTHWINYKWQTYVRYVHFSYIAFASLLAFLLTLFTAISYDWHYMKVTYGLNQSVVCTDDKSRRAGPEVVIRLNEVGIAPMAIGYIIISLVAIGVMHDIYKILRLRRRYIALENATSILCGILSIIFLVDYTWCSRLTHLREDWQWTVGLVAIFAAWLHIIIVMRHLPLFTPFMFQLGLLFRTSIKAALPLTVVLVGILAAQWITTKGMIAYNKNWSRISMVFSNPAISTALEVVVIVTLCIFLMGEGRAEQLVEYKRRQRIEVIQKILDIDLLYPFLRKKYFEHNSRNGSLNAKIIEDDVDGEITTEKKLDTIFKQSETVSRKMEDIYCQIIAMQHKVDKLPNVLHKGIKNH